MNAFGHITAEEAEFLTPVEPRTPVFYGLPKIHKKFERLPPFRPIVSGCGSVCERISNFVDYHLQALVKRNASFVKDTTDFCRKISNVKCKEGTILVSADVSALYTEIDHDDGIRACEIKLDERPDMERVRMPTHYIRQLLNIILKCNCFRFKEKYYHQQCGTAMGTPMAPGYANLFMNMVETQMLAEYEKITGLSPKIWLRFLDDIFIVWEHGPDELSKFQKFMQDFGEHSKLKTTLKFTFESGQSVPFLDTSVSVEGGGLRTDLFSKETDAHLYLRRDSCHPPACSKGLIKGELLRARRICSTQEGFEKAATSMKGFFMERGFSTVDVNKVYGEVLQLDREEVLEYKPREKNDRVPFVITFHPRLRKLGTLLHKYFYLLQTNERLKRAFSQPPMVAFKRLRNLKDSLVHSSMKEETLKEDSHKCNGKRCKCCQNLIESKSVEINGKNHVTLNGGSCKSSNLIYGVKCKKCESWYIGETKMRLHERLNQHRSSIGKLRKGGSLDKSNDTGLSEHFATEGHNFEVDADLYILEHGEWGSSEERKCKESFYICKYKTLEPSGMNKKPGSMGDLYEKVSGRI